ncbi:MAG TPA: hypothetical protein PKH24_20965 [Sedimentisphaerales bacterium]|jgi:hypothetical protein|nr:hypothetical protein [Sedimentisphaerales bacterium]HNU31657.1 hypothetical protein [Sedimentisphaerales bacterium]
MNSIETLLTRLLEHQVDFVLVGGFAAVAYGSTLMTQDLDVCLRFETDNLTRLQESLADLHPTHRMTPKRLPWQLTVEVCKDLKNLYLTTDLGQLGCLGMIQAIGDFEHVKKHSVAVPLPAGICRILDLDALIRSKEAMNRPRDRETVVQLKAIRQRLHPKGKTPK